MANYLRFLRTIRAVVSNVDLSAILFHAVQEANLCTAVELSIIDFDKEPTRILASFGDISASSVQRQTFCDDNGQLYLIVKYNYADGTNKKSRRVFKLLLAAFELRYQSLHQQKAAMVAQLKSQHYEKLLNAISEGIILTDLNGYIFYINTALSQLLKTVAIGFNIKDVAQDLLTKDSNTVFVDNFESRAKGITTTYEVVTKDDDGNPHILSVRGVPIRDINNKPIATVAVVRDITTEMNVKQDLEVSRAVAEKARSAERLFLANMSHEIRSPISAVIGMTHLLFQTDLNEEQLDYLDAIKFSS